MNSMKGSFHRQKRIKEWPSFVRYSWSSFWCFFCNSGAIIIIVCVFFLHITNDFNCKYGLLVATLQFLREWWQKPYIFCIRWREGGTGAQRYNIPNPKPKSRKCFYVLIRTIGRAELVMSFHEWQKIAQVHCTINRLHILDMCHSLNKINVVCNFKMARYSVSSNCFADKSSLLIGK